MWFMLSDDGGNGAWIKRNLPTPALLPPSVQQGWHDLSGKVSSCTPRLYA